MIKTAWYQHDRQTDQHGGAERPEIAPRVHVLQRPSTRRSVGDPDVGPQGNEVRPLLYALYGNKLNN